MIAQHAPPSAQPSPQSAPPPLPPQVMAQLMARQQGVNAPPSQPMGAPQQGAPGQAPPQGGIPPQVLQQIMQARQAQLGGQGQPGSPPQMPPQGAPRPPMPPGAQGMPPQGMPPQGQPGQPPPGAQHIPATQLLPPGPQYGQNARPPQGGLPPPGASQGQDGQALAQGLTGHPPMPPQGAPQPGQAPPQGGIPPQVLQQLMAQKQGAPPQAPSAQQGLPPTQQNGLPQVPPALLQQMQQAKIAMQTGQPLPQGPLPPDVLKHVIQQTLEFGNHVSQHGMPTPQQMQQLLGQKGQAPQGQPAPQAPQGAAPDAHAPLAQQAKDGTHGDSIIAHLTPGEISIPPQVQTPQLMHTIQQAMAAKGVDPQQFTAGSPQQSINPQTGHPQFSFFSTILPIAAIAAVSIFAPELAPALASYTPLLAGAAGAGATLATGGTWQQAAMTGLGAAAGGYLFGGGASAAKDAAASAANTAAMSGAPGEATNGLAGSAVTSDLGSSSPITSGSALTNPSVTTGNLVTEESNLGLGTGASGASTASNTASEGKGLLRGITNTNLGFGQSLSDPTQNATLGQALYPVMGGMFGSSLAGEDTSSSSSQLPSSFTSHLHPITPNFGQYSGSGQSTLQSNFAGYNPYQSVTGINPTTGQPGQAGYNFFPTPGNPTTPTSTAAPNQGPVISQANPYYPVVQPQPQPVLQPA